MDSIEYLKEKMRWLKNFNIQSPAARLGICSIGITPQGFTLAYAKQNAQQVELILCETISCEPKNFQAILTDVVKEYHLSGIKCVWMLQPEDYSLFTMEELPVSADEFQSAIRWKIKKLITFSTDDAVIDYFSIPAPLITDPKKNMTVVVAQASRLSPIAEQLNNAGLNLATIDIPELGLRNISSLYEQDESSTALVYLREKNSLLQISRQQEFYMSRKLELDLNAFISASPDQTGDHLDHLALQLQRSFDYYHSQWRRPPPDKLLVVSPQPLLNTTQQQLHDRLNIKVIEVDLNEKLICKNKLTLPLQDMALPMIGGTLRTENKAHAAN